MRTLFTVVGLWLLLNNLTSVQPAVQNTFPTATQNVKSPQIERNSSILNVIFNSLAQSSSRPVQLVSSIIGQSLSRAVKNVNSIQNRMSSSASNISSRIGSTSSIISQGITTSLEGTREIGRQLNSRSEEVFKDLSNLLPVEVGRRDNSRILTVIKAVSEGLSIGLTNKVLNLVDNNVPDNVLSPFRKLVACGNRLVNYWDRRRASNGIKRNGKNGDGKRPGTMEMLSYGMRQMKKLVSGQPLRKSDGITRFASASQSLLQGVLVVQELVKRVLSGYEEGLQRVRKVEERIRKRFPDF